MKDYHKPVLLDEVIEYLEPRSGDVIVDATFGFGGHSNALLDRIGPKGRIIAFEQDREIFDLNQTGLDSRITLVNDNFSTLISTLKKLKVSKVDKILFDLGISSYHFDQSNLGFSFNDEELDMRLDRSLGDTAADIVNEMDEDDLANLLYENANEFLSRRIARIIVEHRKHSRITSAKELSEVIGKNVRRRGKINPATKTFQALRIAVNNELGVLKQVLPEATKSLKKGGRIAVISFHSLEDKIVKEEFKKEKLEGKIEIITKKPLVASLEEKKENPRSRSAKLRVSLKK